MAYLLSPPMPYPRDPAYAAKIGLVVTPRTIQHQQRQVNEMRTLLRGTQYNAIITTNRPNQWTSRRLSPQRVTQVHQGVAYSMPRNVLKQPVVTGQMLQKENLRLAEMRAIMTGSPYRRYAQIGPNQYSGIAKAQLVGGSSIVGNRINAAQKKRVDRFLGQD